MDISIVTGEDMAAMLGEITATCPGRMTSEIADLVIGQFNAYKGTAAGQGSAAFYGRLGSNHWDEALQLTNLLAAGARGCAEALDVLTTVVSYYRFDDQISLTAVRAPNMSIRLLAWWAHLLPTSQRQLWFDVWFAELYVLTCWRRIQFTISTLIGLPHLIWTVRYPLLRRVEP
ncbi:MAG TPA: hypothetical protein VFX70_12520 [Mycobacteriales bacterium]|nr:hypothetical protein [Mycobacteriales bacterium]